MSFACLKACVVIVLLHLPLLAHAGDDNPLSWCQFDLPPMYIADGPNAGKGIVDGHVEFLMQKMPEYQHRQQRSNIARTLADLKAGEHLVCGGMQKNAERVALALFSEPFLATLPPRLILPRSKLEQLKPWLNSAGELRLSEAIQKSGLSLGISSGRSYGRVIDEQLSLLKNHAHIITRPAADGIGEGLVRMMMLGRLDMALAFGSEERLYREVYHTPNDALLALPIEGMPRYIPLYFTAPNNAWGQQVIKRINALVRQNWADTDFRRSAFYGQDAEARARSEAWLHEQDPNHKP